MDTTVRAGWGWPGNIWDKGRKVIKGKPLWFGIPQRLWLRSADWSKGNLSSSNTENPRRIMSKIWATIFRKFVFCKCFSLVLKWQTALKACIPYFYLLIYPDFVLSRLTLPGNILFLNGGSPVVSTSLSDQAAGLQISAEFLDFTDTKNRYARTLKKWAKTNQYRLKQQISRDFTHFAGDNAVFCNHTVSGQSTTDSTSQVLIISHQTAKP